MQKKSEKTNERLPRKILNLLTDRRTERWTDKDDFIGYSFYNSQLLIQLI